MLTRGYKALRRFLGTLAVAVLLAVGTMTVGGTADAQAKPPVSREAADAFEGMRELMAKTGEVLRSLPEVRRGLATVNAKLGDRGGDLWLRLLAGLVLGVLAELAVHFAVARHRRASPGSLPAVAGHALLDVAALIPLWLVLYGFASYGLAADGLPGDIADVVLSNVLFWRFAVLVPRLWFRPAEPALRIAKVDDRDARQLYHTFSVAVLGYMAARSMISVLIVADAPTDTIAAAGFLNNIWYTVIDITAIFVMRHAMARWLVTLVAPTGGWRPFKLWLARYWFALGILADLTMSLAYAWGTLTGHHNVGSDIVASLALVLGLIFLEALYDYLQRPTDAEAAATADNDAKGQRPIDLVARCLRFMTRLLILFLVVNIWIFDVLQSSLTDKQAALLGGGMRDAFLFISVAYVLWQAACYYIARTLGVVTSGGDATQVNSRLHTMLPLARVALGVTISVLTVLTILSRLGVDIAPLIAGASVLGLAISFGSQTLVRDIVSGIFYLADDAFRVGEYIEAGRMKGTVEGFTLRSVKLRHQNGPLHTVPFGQLGSITNYSRDWITLKFNLRVVRDVDLEFVRKSTKKIGTEMLEDPELKAQILEPLKMQGVADILDNALVLRFKVMVKPGNPALVQRQAIKRIIARYGELGIKFPSSTVTVQTVGAQDVQNPALAAVAMPANR